MSIDFSGVDWYVILAVSLGKLIIFLFTLVVVLVISRGKSVGLAGLLAIFTSQSNDVALAYPVRKFDNRMFMLISHYLPYVVRLLYPDLASYIYLFAPAQLVILNPFAYFALEWHKTQEKAAVNSVIALDGDNITQSGSPLICKRVLKVMDKYITLP